ncbi:MAG: rRNA maturation RNase YbeY [Clostridia bacterium]|nr:rRNA maturation RNase YbeY [Clostridia bacterium]
MDKNKFVELVYKDIEECGNYEEIINLVINKCFEVEKLENLNLYISITLTTPEQIRTINNEFRKINKETDVLSFPMFEKYEIDEMVELGKNEIPETIGDIIISVQRVKEQAEEYGHSFERELAYMVVHGFYHLMGYDHIVDEDKVMMREREENILNILNIIR